MKKTSAILLFIILVSCEDLYQEQGAGYIDLKTREEKVDFLNGIYDILIDVYNRDYFYLYCKSDDMAFRGFTASENDRNSGAYKTKPFLPGMNGKFPELVFNTYTQLYKAIIEANSIIIKTEANDFPYILGEAYMLRAYCYLQLAHFFGTPPIVKDLVVNYHIPLPTHIEIFEFIEGDMRKAIDLLPDTPQEARIPYETPHKGNAKAFLAEVYLAMAGYPAKVEKKYAEAAKLAGEVIENAQVYGYALLDDFADLWNTDKKYHSEEVFSLYFNDSTKTNSLTWHSIEFQYPDDLFIFFSRIRFYPDFKYFNRFPHNYRKISSMITGRYYEDQIIQPEGRMTIKKYELLDPELYPIDFIEHWGCLKWRDVRDIYGPNKWVIIDSLINERDDLWGFKQQTTNLFLLRYAHTLLTYAEAKARIGELDAGALEALNKVRRRANHTDINAPSEFDIPETITTEQFIDTVVTERSYEFFMEPNGRWFDIVRLDLKETLPARIYNYKHSTFASKFDLFTDEWYFFKFPKEDIWLNDSIQ